MRITTKFGRIERKIYEWDESDIRRALLASENIADYQPGRRYEFEIGEGDIDDDGNCGPAHARLVVIYERDQMAGPGEG